jgi:molecular chaperone Hsp33
MTAPSSFTRRFTFGGGRVRGEQVVLEDAWRSIRARREYPAPLASALGELVAACALFTSTLKTLQEDGRLTLQIQGGSPVSLVVVECGAAFDVRAMAQWNEDFDESALGSLATMAKGARCVLTIDPGGDYEAYQSVVPLQHDTVAATLNAYMAMSEQIPSRFVLAADGGRAAGLLVQELPATGGAAPVSDEDQWNRIETLTSTLTSDELLGQDADTVLRRLFLANESEVRTHAERAVRFRCRCSRERIEGVLRILGENELRGLLADQGKIDIACDFCRERYVLSSDEAWAAFRSTATT